MSSYLTNRRTLGTSCLVEYDTIHVCDMCGERSTPGDAALPTEWSHVRHYTDERVRLGDCCPTCTKRTRAALQFNQPYTVDHVGPWPS